MDWWLTANAKNYYAAQTITNRIEPNRVTLYHSRCRWIFSKEFVQLPNIVCSIFDSFSNRIVAISEPFHQISLQLSMININWQIACLYLMSAPAPFFISFVFFLPFFLYLCSVSVLLPLLSTKSVWFCCCCFFGILNCVK